jgi:hypothetical protein
MDAVGGRPSAPFRNVNALNTLNTQQEAGR